MSEIKGGEQSKKDFIRYYRQDAEKYDAARFSCKCSWLYDRLYKEVIYGYLKDCKYVLDAGTGTGRFSIYLAQHGISVMAIDTSEEMLEIARKKAQQAGCLERMQFMVADIERLPFEDNTFDGFCSVNVLIHLASRKKAIAELARVLKPGGIGVLNVPGRLARAYRPFLSLAGKTTFHDYYYDAKEIKGLFRDNSIKIVKRKAIGKIPRLAIHPFLCVLKLGFLEKAIISLEKLNFGGTSIVKGIKSI